MNTSLSTPGTSALQRVDGLRALQREQRRARAWGSTSQREPMRCLDVGDVADLAGAVDDDEQVVAAVDEHQVVDDRAFVGQQQAVALLAAAPGRSRRPASGSRRRRRHPGPASRSWPMCETSNRPAALRVWWCSAIRPAGYCTGMRIAGEGHHAGAEFQVQRMQRGLLKLLSGGGGHSGLSEGQGSQTMVHTMGGPCCPLYLRDSPRYAGLLLRWAAALRRRPLSSKVTPRDRGALSVLCA